ncbi:MAG: LysE family translocator [Alphaproteobacteria bacterium]|nr:LysE family translocator [Alphaproteobacteria bacterium]
MSGLSSDALLIFAATEFLLCLSPGPAVLLVLGLSARRGFGAGMAATAGILAANIMYFSLSAVGIGAVILASQLLFTVLKWAGAAYLLYLGITMAWPPVRRLIGRRAADGHTPPPARSVVIARDGDRGRWKSARRGFVMQAANPKNLAFFVAILPQFIHTGDTVALQLAVLGAISVLLELPVLVVYSAAAAWSAALLGDRVMTWIEGVAGGFLIVIATGLATLRRAA